ncbi:MAG TPA: enoyl-CoA hydratase [Candidatus Binataceae bacterium]|nr:enoyl-CoA hydratase [Candidatus Binataceae bacterium]
MSEPVVLVSIDNRLATVTLNRPEKLNALSAELRSAFVREMQKLRPNREVGCVIITGAGRAFCAGLDLRELSSAQLREMGGANFVSVIEDMEVPVIAAVNGFAVTGGFELALACDIMIAADTAQFADTHARVGVMPGGGMTARLPEAVGIRKARELSFTGNYLTAQEAERLGLVNRVVPKDKLMDTARELAAQILSCDPLMIRQLKRLYDLNSRSSVGDGLRYEQDFSRAHSLSRDLSDMDTRRQRVMERGRSQKASH